MRSAGYPLTSAGKPVPAERRRRSPIGVGDDGWSRGWRIVEGTARWTGSGGGVRWGASYCGVFEPYPALRPGTSFKVPGKKVGAEGGIRTHTGVYAQRFLRPSRLPFRHFGKSG